MGSLGYCFSLVSPQLVLGPSGVLQGIRPGKCYVDMSTVDADTVTELAQVAALSSLALQHVFSWSTRPPRLSAHHCMQLGDSIQSQREQRPGVGLACFTLHSQSCSMFAL